MPQQVVGDFIRQFAEAGSWSLLLSLLPIGIVFGAAHALAPGHSKSVLAAYVTVYIAMFLWFAWKLKDVADGFRIKSELKFTGAVALVAAIPWFVFNIALRSFNNNVFPLSTLCLS